MHGAKERAACGRTAQTKLSAGWSAERAARSGSSRSTLNPLTRSKGRRNQKGTHCLPLSGLIISLPGMKPQRLIRQ
ncbi:MAG: hypothetical protein ACJ0DJ_05350 [bacterium]